MPKKLLLICNQEDRNYLQILKDTTADFAGLHIQFTHALPATFLEIASVCKAKEYDGILTTSHALLQKLVGTKISQSEASLNDYAGSYFKQSGVEFIILRPLVHLVAVPYGKFLARRYVSKLAAPESWVKFPEFQWCILDGANIEQWYALFASSAILVAFDIETGREPQPYIKSIAYAGLFPDGQGGYVTYSVALKIKSPWAVIWMRKFNEIAAPKIAQNGKYDINYLLMYNSPVHNYMFDTATLFHCWFSELPKTLGFLQSFFVRTAAYWKDLADSGNLEDQLLYNCKDTWATLMACLAAIDQMPQWAIENYKNEFPLNFPCILSEMTGLKRDMTKLEEVNTEWQGVAKELQGSLNRMMAIPEGKDFNSASPKQKKAFLKTVGCADIAEVSTDEKSLKKAAYRHPFISKITSKISAMQEARKLLSTYITAGKEFKGYILYALNPHGTDTARLASKGHHFWCGLQLQNIPRDAATVKSTLVAPPGWRIAECDLEQAESRDTAYAAGEERLIAAVSGDKDFHSLNAASFFGVTYEDIYDVALGKVKDKVRRELGKKVNHGANYLMGESVLVDTMGEENVYKAGRLLGLPRFWTARQIAKSLLEKFHATYPGLSKLYYPAVVAEVMTTKMLRSRATHTCKYQGSPQGWTRYCFGNPSANKRDKNSYVAHVSQNLNAITLNKAFMVIFYELAMAPKYRDNFRLLGQIHDSVLFLFREGHEYLCDLVRERMEIPVRIVGYDGKVREFTVPAAIKAGFDGKGAFNWGEI